MAIEISPQYDPKDVEERIYKLWEESGFFDPDKLPTSYKLQAKSFSIVVPPPNVTGSLHMGHALNAVIQDILIRKRRMEGFKALWIPGTDHAGIATQNVVEKDLRKQGISRHELGREKFLERVWEWKEKYGNTILNQFKKLGSSMDWSRTRFTMDDGYRKAVEEAFIHYHKKGWIYRAERVVNWCIRCATSLSDLELEYREEKTSLYYIKYPLTENSKFETLNPKQIQNSKSEIPNYIIVATTRPETMLGDTAVAVNPKDARYKDIAGKNVLLPIQNREIPVIADDAVESEFGTGAVKVTPAHDMLDSEIGARHKLASPKVIGQNGRMTKEAGAICDGLKVAECREKVIEELKRLNLLEREEPYTHNVSLCYRCGSVIEPIPSMQWFLKMSELAEIATDAVKSGKVKFHPERWEKVYFDWLANIRDWCISRQIWWGHRLPVYFCKNKQEEISNFQFPISKKLEDESFENLELKIENSSADNFLVSAIEPLKCPYCGNCKMERADDVLDTWFSSALWPFATLGFPQKTQDLKDFYPTSVLSTARDIINLWVARMVFSGIEFMGEVPFKDVIIHATILTKDGKRMSKSLGTGIDPMTLIEKYGSDATRFGLIWQAMGNQDIHWSEEHVVAGRKFCNKMWNATRFILLQIPNFKSQIPNKSQIQNPKFQTADDKNIIEVLERIKKEVSENIDKYEFGPALHLLYDFFWHEFCDKYIEKSKTQITNSKSQTSTCEILLYVLSESLKLLHPFMPHITEEIWSHLPIENKNMLIVEKWPQ